MTTTRTLPVGKRRGKVSNLTLIDAYRAVFKSDQIGVNAQIDLVLSDLAEFSGYFAVPPEGTNLEGMFRDAGRREVFARILSLIGVSSEDRELIRAAALEELSISNEEGTR
jgi:hypothetical protein